MAETQTEACVNVTRMRTHQGVGVPSKLIVQKVYLRCFVKEWLNLNENHLGVYSKYLIVIHANNCVSGEGLGHCHVSDNFCGVSPIANGWLVGYCKRGCPIWMPSGQHPPPHPNQHRRLPSYRLTGEANKLQHQQQPLHTLACQSSKLTVQTECGFCFAKKKLNLIKIDCRYYCTH